MDRQTTVEIWRDVCGGNMATPPTWRIIEEFASRIVTAECKPAPRWWRCDTHGPAHPTAWGCPECVREMREELEIAGKSVSLLGRVLRAIPECPAHGPSCIPHALEWIEHAKAALAAQILDRR